MAWEQIELSGYGKTKLISIVNEQEQTIENQKFTIAWQNAELRKQTAIDCASIILNDSEWQTWKCECCEDYVCTTCRVKEKFGLEI